MKCFAHPQTDAVGFCANCARGLCPECASGSVKRLSCAGECRDELSAAARRTELAWARHEIAHRLSTGVCLLVSAAALALAFVAREETLKFASASICTLMLAVALLQIRLSIHRR